MTTETWCYCSLFLHATLQYSPSRASWNMQYKCSDTRIHMRADKHRHA